MLLTSHTTAAMFFDFGVKMKKFVWVIIVYPLIGKDCSFHVFFNLYKSENAPEVMQTTIKTDGAIDKSDIQIVIKSDYTWKFFE